jgi:hypothetical protein
MLSKGQWHEIFCFLFFFMNQFPPDPQYSIRTISNFLEKSRRYSQVKVHHRYQQHWSQICHRYQQHQQQILPPVSLVVDTSRKFEAGINTGGNFPRVSTTPAANLPPVSMTSVANNANNIRLLSSDLK